MADIAIPPKTMTRFREEVVEAAAEAIYTHWQFEAKVPWVKGGNSLMQNKARDFARVALSAGIAAWPGMNDTLDYYGQGIWLPVEADHER